jgi:predicted metal-dependent hydrolase
MNDSLRLDELEFTIRRSDRRQTIGLTVERDGSLTAAVPVDCALEDVELVIRKKLVWVYRRLAERLPRPAQHPRIKQFVTGEGFDYLGRTYRLALVDTELDNPPLRFHQGRFFLQRDELAGGRELFTAWYTTHGTLWLTRRLDQFVDRVGATPTGLRVRDLSYRWGSCTGSSVINIHWQALQFPPRIIDYILVHELVHLLEPNHGSAFWQRVERVFPDHAERRRWLAEHGAFYEIR